MAMAQFWTITFTTAGATVPAIYDIDTQDIPLLLGTGYIDLSRIGRVSRFRAVEA
jgi:hypothetical protein